MDEIRSVPFTVTRTAEEGDGLTLEGYAAVFNSPTEINARNEGHFLERILPGAFKRSLGRRTPVLMFNHGQHPLVGEMPIGKITEAREDAQGLFIRARMHDNWLIEPVRDAIASGAIDGMSFRFSVPKGGDAWRPGKDGLRERDLLHVNCSECGPVVSPAYEQTSVALRSGNEPITKSDLVQALWQMSDGVTTEVPKERDQREMGGFMFGDAGTIVEDAIEDQLYPDAMMLCVCDMSDRQAVYMVMQDGESELYQIDYSIGEDGAVTLGTPTEVLKKTMYVPAPASDLADEGPSGSPGMNSNDLPPARPSLNPDQKELRRQGLMLVAQHQGVIPK